MITQKIVSRFIKFLILLSLLLTITVKAETIQSLMDSNSKSLFNQLDKERDLYENNEKALFDLIELKISDFFYFTYMGHFSTGRHWKTMTDNQQQRFQVAFKKLLIKAYANAVLRFSYKDLTIEKAKQARKKNQFWLTMYAKNKNNSIQIDYLIAKTKSGYKIINVKVEGINLLVNYRKSFLNILSKKNGIEKLITKIEPK